MAKFHDDGPYEPTTEDQVAFVPGQWYMFFVLGGFTMIGRYICPLGYDRHRFRHVSHLRNAGGLSLPEICAGKTSGTLEMKGPFPDDWCGTPLHYTGYRGKK